MALDRDAALKNAEKALRQGRIDAAIAEYQRVIEAHPRDWNSANALGDLYVRSGQVDAGVSFYTRIADQLTIEGFFPKAGALYKKILKVKPGDEYALLQTAEIGAKQGLLVEAKAAFKTVSDAKRRRGDIQGAAELDIRVGTLDPDDLEARLVAARAASEIGDTATALRELREVARKFEQQGRTDELIEVLVQLVAIDPDDLDARAGLAQSFAAKGKLERAREYLTVETAGSNASLWLTLAEIELSAGRFEEGKAAVAHALLLNGSMRDMAVELGCRLETKSPDSGYPCLDAVTDHAVASRDFVGAAAALLEFTAHNQTHLIALMRLVEVCVDGELESEMYDAQGQLTDAYLDAGRGLEARIVSEDLVAHDPADRANIERFRRALVMLGEADPDAIIAEQLSGDSPFLATDSMDFNEGVFFGEATKPAEPSPESTVVEPRRLEDVFQEIRAEVEEPDEETAAEQLALAQTYRDLGMMDDAIEALENAARSPRQRFEAAGLLGQVFREQGELIHAVEWFERASEAAPPSADAGHGVLYDLAETLVELGEHERALAVFVELEAESGGYRDVADRIDRLSTLAAK